MGGLAAPLLGKEAGWSLAEAARCRRAVGTTAWLRWVALPGILLFGWNDVSTFLEPAAPGEQSDRVFRQAVVFREDQNAFRKPEVMVWRKWNTVYVRVEPRRGVRLLLVEKLRPADQHDSAWTAVDTAKRVAVVNLQNRTVYTARAQNNITYGPAPTLSREEKEAVERASWEIVRRAARGHDVVNVVRRAHVGRSRYRALLPLIEFVTTAGAVMWSWSSLGIMAASALFCWRVSVYLGIPALLSYMYESVRGIKSAGDNAYDAMEYVYDRYEEGHLDLALLIAASVLLLCAFACHKPRRSKRKEALAEFGSGSPVPSDSSGSPLDSPRVEGTEASGESSAGEEDPKMVALKEQNEKLLSVVEQLSQKVDQQQQQQTAALQMFRPAPGLPPPLQVPLMQPSASPEEVTGIRSDPKVQQSVDTLMERLMAAQGVIASDASGEAEPQTPRARTSLSQQASPGSGSTVKTLELSSPEGTPKRTVSAQIELLERDARSPKQMALEHLRKYEENADFRIAADARVRVAPAMVAKLYRKGNSAAEELENIVRQKGLESCHAAMELPTLGLVLDRIITQTDVQVINLSAVEVICRKIYGLLRCFEDVKCESDWKRPKQAPAKWRSKAKWTLLEEYDVSKLDASSWAIPEADQEVADRLQRKALFNKHLQKFEEGEGGAKSSE